MEVILKVVLKNVVYILLMWGYTKVDKFGWNVYIMIQLLSPIFHTISDFNVILQIKSLKI